MYYINEIAKCDGLYADSASLYTLLLVPDLPQDEALFAIEESFYTKKFNAINKSTWSEEEAKMETLNTLDSSHKSIALSRNSSNNKTKTPVSTSVFYSF